ncbi:hypothetical protein NAEGRDRAFT_66301 [Naegleria gruberi]|uniref:Uncharacterized protein n=1 Tax=Naegleria gruberi TaxID=5762 RepID=D2VBQ9_NAEGR|nr:uncharacterized protein NAEGRDRAFT_66301 [Naegleria gruberi]EFC45951.1 hypothetical protein NAEGRDRAFT_66301 [Naegleria gruberi]|eukprot:XP_002678695.1 hypothetical protein NAEGRDRAFT_66301 [Naegleria gruberi strain NEG-M]
MQQPPLSKSPITTINNTDSASSSLEAFKFGTQNESTRPKSASRPRTPNFDNPLDISPQSTRDFIRTRKDSLAFADEQGNFLTKTIQDEFEKIKDKVSKEMMADSFVDLARLGKIELVKEWLEQSGMDPNMKNKNGVSRMSIF